jgi:hypothetical protein
MPRDASDTYGTVQKNGTATFMARVVDATDTPIQPTVIAAAQYSVYLLDDQDPDSWLAVDGHNGVALAVDQVVLDQLQADSLWTADTLGYNFCHELDVSACQAFPTAGRRYLVEYTLTPTLGQVIKVRFRVYAI